MVVLMVRMIMTMVVAVMSRDHTCYFCSLSFFFLGMNNKTEGRKLMSSSWSVTHEVRARASKLLRGELVGVLHWITHWNRPQTGRGLDLETNSKTKSCHSPIYINLITHTRVTVGVEWTWVRFLLDFMDDGFGG